MTDLQTKLNAFKQVVIENSSNKEFAYREWFIKDHLMIAERIAMELCDKYSSADRNIVFALVWFHDFGKPIDEENERGVTKTKGVEVMREIGLPKDFIKKVLNSWIRMEMKNEIDISKESIEVQIVSTADGASHFVGKFYPSYFEDLKKSGMEAILDQLRNKINKDWERKIVLPEAKESFRERFQRAKEILGEYPDKFLL